MYHFYHWKNHMYDSAFEQNFVLEGQNLHVKNISGKYITFKGDTSP